MQYVEVAPVVVVRHDQPTLTYASQKTLRNGSVVMIPVGSRQILGVVMHETTKPSYNLREVISETPLAVLPQPLIQTAAWIHTYYNAPLATVLRLILPKDLTKNRRSKPRPQSHHRRDRTNFVFTPEQTAAITAIDYMSPGTALLHGVTGSGKTAVYIELAKRTLATGKSVIILVPEIALTSQLVAEFAHHFEHIIVTHSNQTEAQRHHLWLQAHNTTTPQVIIGPRSALFMPLAHVGLIVIDECHEPSYHQEKQPRYNALPVASVLASHHHAKLILGSATPRISDYYRAVASNRPVIAMTKPAHPHTTRPIIIAIDMTQRSNFTRHRFLSDALLHRIAEQRTGEQALLFHNRRGTASTTLCEQCGWQAGCSRCFVPLTLHGDRHKLICHICGQTSRVPTACPSCGQPNIIHKGIGTKLIETELRRLFPQKTIMRFDGDTSPGDTVEKQYHALYDGSVDIIIGTQVIAKGLDLPNLRTVGVVQADAGLQLPDFAAAERSFQLLAQVVGRVGRSPHPTTVIVQSYQPSHPAITDGINQNYADFYTRTLALRRHTNFPPFCYLLKLTCIYKTEATAIKNSVSLATSLRQAFPGLDILGPTPAFYERVHDTYRWQLVIKSPKRQTLLDCLELLPKTHWQYELDPVSLL